MTIARALPERIEPDPVEVERQVARLSKLCPSEDGGYYAAAFGQLAGLVEQLARVHGTTCLGGCLERGLIARALAVDAALTRLERLVGEEGRA